MQGENCTKEGTNTTQLHYAQQPMPQGLCRPRPDPKGDPPPPLRTPVWLYGTMGFVGARGVRDSV